MGGRHDPLHQHEQLVLSLRRGDLGLVVSTTGSLATHGNAMLAINGNDGARVQVLGSVIGTGRHLPRRTPQGTANISGARFHDVSVLAGGTVPGGEAGGDGISVYGTTTGSPMPARFWRRWCVEMAMMSTWHRHGGRAARRA